MPNNKNNNKLSQNNNSCLNDVSNIQLFYNYNIL